ncbi:acyltransferase family protein [Desulfuromonas sp. KJ2020]|uniref:acyltransferase family protein n=1 Tax=Desulfuromonas sp. KJ2020 TaxID=2919173 RepID=UPI0020A76C0B|nr:acyltransferase family protein [Desulfuromonas sp. KJ2020]MCP3178143.1 acyltransferase family protein [Desulfuromonas sp. KJ2020]
MRYYYLDFARGILMSLGVVIHAAQVFSLSPYHIKSKVTSIFYENIVFVIHSFRMQSFYIIAGFFSILLIEKIGLRKFLINRLKRLLLPMLFCGICLNTVMNLFSNEYDGNLNFVFNVNYWLGGAWISHLWFIANLLVYVALLSIIFFYKNIFNKLNLENKKINLFAIFILVPTASFLLVRIGWRLPDWPFGEKFIIFNVSNIFYYFPYFALGIVFYKNKRLYQSIFKYYYLFLFVSITLLIIIISVKYIGTYGRVIEILLGILALSNSFFIMSCFKKFFDSKSVIIKRLSDSSYTIYLLHQPIIVIVASYIVETKISNLFQFLSIIVITWTSSFLIHIILIEKLNVLSILLNGKNSIYKKNNYTPQFKKAEEENVVM